MRRFRLLKDLPNLKAGAVFQSGAASPFYYHVETDFGYPDNAVENNPEWFEEVSESELLWTDADMIRFLTECLQNFKNKRSPLPK